MPLNNLPFISANCQHIQVNNINKCSLCLKSIATINYFFTFVSKHSNVSNNHNVDFVKDNKCNSAYLVSMSTLLIVLPKYSWSWLSNQAF